ncbi:MAG: hypothetical protein DPW09_09595 [Anaerolineae bacterium]|nr:hypothetical protein [Anaerolineales bacterium]MCQ3973683.1 hypothetical protein [Anaerolineae bacterium]
MTHLPIAHMTLYKHGVGYFRRRGPVEGEAIKLTFRREEMDDLLKSLTVLDHGAGQVRGVDYDTPQSQAERLAGNSVVLDDTRSLRDLLVALRGRSVQLLGSDGSTEIGILVGLDEVEEKPLEQSLVTILREGTDMVAALPLNRIVGLELRDEVAAADLRFFLQTAVGQETHRSINIRLSPGSHDLEVSYIAPAPTWRVSYRLVMDEEAKAKAKAEAKPKALLQGWGIFDNRLEEDLTDISLSLTAGMPISFVYDLYTPHTPTRPIVKDEDRVAAAPVMFDAASLKDEVPSAAPPAPAAAAPMMMRKRASVEAERAFSTATMAASVQSAATGQAMGELFQYNVSVPVTVGRGQSAMVPIVSSNLGCKKDLIYNGSKMPTHPVATLRFKNETGLTLERGPVTVLENGEYVGEAVLPFTADGAEAVISYAVELGLRIKEEIKTESQLQSLRIKEGYLLQNLYDIRRTTYHLDNRTTQAKTILIEHSLSDYVIFDTPDPAEKTLDTHRYQVEALPGKITDFLVQERYLRSRREELRNLSYQGLQRYFADKLLDQKAYDSLRALLDAWAEISRLEKASADQEQQRSKIYKAQEQAQKNMTVLSNAGEEGKLRGRYVKQLTESEEQLAQIDQTVARLQAEINQKQANIERMIAGLAA